MRTSPLYLLAAAALLSMSACSADEDQAPAADTGQGGGGEQEIGAGGSESEVETPELCPSATGTYAADKARSNVLFLYDRSGSMQLKIGEVTRWEAMKKGFFELLDGLPTDVSAGFEVFPRGDAEIDCCKVTKENDLDCGACTDADLPGTAKRCDAETYATPQVAVSPLDAMQRDLIKSRIAKSDDKYYWGTPMAPALEGAIAHLRTQAFEGVSSVVLLTDGNPTSCETKADPKADSLKRVREAAASGLSADSPIRTFVLGIVDGKEGAAALGASEENLSKIAIAGGTARFEDCAEKNECAYAVNTDTFDDDLEKALDAIALDAFGCVFDVPKVDGGKPDFASLNVTVTTPDSATTTIAKDTKHVDGWDYLPGNSQFQLYGKACSAIKSDAASKVEVVLGCETVGE